MVEDQLMTTNVSSFEQSFNNIKHMHCLEVRHTDNRVAVFFEKRDINGAVTKVRDMMTSSSTPNLYQIGSEADAGQSCRASHFYEFGNKFLVGCTTFDDTAAQNSLFEVGYPIAP